MSKASTNKDWDTNNINNNNIDKNNDDVSNNNINKNRDISTNNINKNVNNVGINNINKNNCVIMWSSKQKLLKRKLRDNNYSKLHLS